MSRFSAHPAYLGKHRVFKLGGGGKRNRRPPAGPWAALPPRDSAGLGP